MSEQYPTVCLCGEPLNDAREKRLHAKDCLLLGPRA